MRANTKYNLEEAAEFGVQIRRDVPLAPLTTMKVGGPAEYFATVNQQAELIALVRWAQRARLPYFILGGGSNILISDAGIQGLVIYNRCRQTEIVHQADGVLFQAESGAAMAGVARTSVRAGLTGLEWGISVPGTIGGAVVGNAGAHGGEIKDNLVLATLLDTEGHLVHYTLAEFAYRYRASSLKQLPESNSGQGTWQPLQAGFRPVVLQATFGLAEGDGEVINEQADRFLNHRRRTQPVEPSLGSTFVNPPGDYAGRLIEEVGLKGYRVGGAEISQTHANFVINPGGTGRNAERPSATASDILELIEHVQTTVAECTGIMLTPEVQLAG